MAVSYIHCVQYSWKVSSRGRVSVSSSVCGGNHLKNRSACVVFASNNKIDKVVSLESMIFLMGQRKFLRSLYYVCLFSDLIWGFLCKSLHLFYFPLLNDPDISQISTQIIIMVGVVTCLENKRQRIRFDGWVSICQIDIS